MKASRYHDVGKKLSRLKDVRHFLDCVESGEALQVGLRGYGMELPPSCRSAVVNAIKADLAALEADLASEGVEVDGIPAGYLA